MATDRPLPYARQSIDEEDVARVVAALRSDWLTTGPVVDAFEEAVAARCGVAHAVAMSSGTAALHAINSVLGLGAGDEVIVPAMTFVATANAVCMVGATPRFADVDRSTLLIDPDAVETLIGPATRAVVAVDYAGQCCDYQRLQQLCDANNLTLIADACHSLGGDYGGRPVGSLARLSAFSFHPVKPITTAEGGMVTSDDRQLATALRRFRNHGIDSDARQRAERREWGYAMESLGWNYRMSELHAALGLSQLTRLDEWIDQRSALAEHYRRALATVDGVEPLALLPERRHAWHLMVVRCRDEALRQRLFQRLRDASIAAVVHYPALHLHPFYRRHHGGRDGLCPVAEGAAGTILSLPLYPAMDVDDVERVVDVVAAAALEAAA